MTLDQLFRQKKYDRIWQEYCGFVDFSLTEYMEIQRRLLMEQLQLLASSTIGRQVLGDADLSTPESFRRTVPLTTYDNYADILLARDEDALPAPPVAWIETTWVGGKHPVKAAPYSDSMIRCHKNNVIASILLSTSRKKGEIALRPSDRFLYGLAPLPYLTGIIPHVLAGELTVDFLPPTDAAEGMGFRERSALGLRMGMEQGVDLFFGLSSIIVRMGESFASGGGSGGAGKLLGKASLPMLRRLLSAKLRAKKTGEPIRPRDIWDLKGLVCTGTDSALLKPRIEALWGVRPHEIFAGTEPTIVGTELWSRNGLVFFPDVCFYEFIPMSEFFENLDNPAYVPRTYTMEEVVPGTAYELVVTNFKGGVFARYRTGDMFSCLSVKNPDDGIDYPQFRYLDRVPTVIDIAGFTRITQETVEEAIRLSRIEVRNWLAAKEYGDDERSFMHLYVEFDELDAYSGADQAGLVAAEMLREHIGMYFRYVDSDYSDLRRMMGMDPLKVTVLQAGIIDRFSRARGKPLRRMNPDRHDMIELMKFANM